MEKNSQYLLTFSEHKVVHDVRKVGDRCGGKVGLAISLRQYLAKNVRHVTDGAEVHLCGQRCRAS